jgi:hypothetical protein
LRSKKRQKLGEKRRRSKKQKEKQKRKQGDRDSATSSGAFSKEGNSSPGCASAHKSLKMAETQPRQLPLAKRHSVNTPKHLAKDPDRDYKVQHHDS